MKAILLSVLGLASLACSAGSRTESAARPAAAAAPALAVAPLAGQTIPVLPITMLIAEPPTDEYLPGDRAERLAWVDSLVGEMLLEHGPEVTWVLPPELRRVAARAPNMMPEPDRMGQAVMRAPNLDRIPDPLRSYLRALSAMTNARLVMIPAAARLAPDSGAVRAELVLLLADSRSGAVVWRSHPTVLGDTPRAALRAAMAHILPDLD